MQLVIGEILQKVGFRGRRASGLVNSIGGLQICAIGHAVELLAIPIAARRPVHHGWRWQRLIVAIALDRDRLHRRLMNTWKILNQISSRTLGTCVLLDRSSLI